MILKKPTKRKMLKEGKIMQGEKISKRRMFASIHRGRVTSLSTKPTHGLDKKSYFRVAIHGAGSVGKSCIIERLTKSTFTDKHIPTVSEVYETELRQKEKILGTLWLYDTAGSLDFPAMNRLTISKSDACILVYSVDSVKSLEIAGQKLQEIVDLQGKHFSCLLIGNKSDVTKREVTFEGGLRCAVKYGASYIETSAKSNVNINEAFETVVKKIHYMEQFQQKLLQERKKVEKSFSGKR